MSPQPSGPFHLVRVLEDRSGTQVSLNSCCGVLLMAIGINFLKAFC